MLIFGKKIKFSAIFWFLFYFLIFVALLKNSYSYLDPDLGWHLKAGENISLTGEVSRENFYNYTFSGDWINHEWLVDWLSFEIYNQEGYLTLSIIFALVIITFLILLNITARRLAGPSSGIPIAVIQLLGLYASLPHFGIRMQEFSILFLLLELLIINNFRNLANKRSLVWLLPLFLVWVNVHGSFLFGLAVFAFWILVEFVQKALERIKKVNVYLEPSRLQVRDLITAVSFLILTIGITFINPYKAGLYSFLSGYGNTAYLGLIAEWLPLYTFPIGYLKLIYLGILSAAWLLYLYEVVRHKNIRLDWWQFSLFILFLILVFGSKRNFPLALAATFPFFIKILAELFDWSVFQRAGSSGKIRWLLVICLILSITGLSIDIPYKKDPFSGFCAEYPCQAVKFLQDRGEYDNYKIFNEYGWGGYLIWVYPERQLFIDGRLPQASFAGKTFIEEYSDFFKEDSDKEAKLSEHDIQLILLRTKDEPLKVKKWEKIFFRLSDEDLRVDNYLRGYLNSTPDWEIVYQDKTATIYIRD